MAAVVFAVRIADRLAVAGQRLDGRVIAQVTQPGGVSCNSMRMADVTNDSGNTRAELYGDHRSGQHQVGQGSEQAKARVLCDESGLSLPAVVLACSVSS